MDRKKYLLKWEVDDFVFIDYSKTVHSLGLTLTNLQNAKKFFMKYTSASVVKIKKWDMEESLVEFSDGSTQFITTKCIDRNLSCDERIKLGKMESFMKERNPNKQERRDENLNELLEK